MILDTSAIVAVIRDEPERPDVIEMIAGRPQVGVGAPTLTEASIVLVRRYGPTGQLILARFLEEHEVVEIPFDRRHWTTSAEAYIRYGKGRHPAALNYGDCMTYATARVADVPLLFIGDDFAKTDLTPALV